MVLATVLATVLVTDLVADLVSAAVITIESGCGTVVKVYEGVCWFGSSFDGLL
jgi:hypothetical protein